MMQATSDNGANGTAPNGLRIDVAERNFLHGILKVKSVFETMSDENSKDEFYHYGYADALRRLLKKATGFRWNLDLMNDRKCDLEEVCFFL